MEVVHFPYFIPCTEQEWNDWNKAATELMISKYGSGGGNNYSNPFNDAEGQRYFIVNPEVQQVVPEERRSGLQFDQITWPQPEQ